MHTRLVNNIKCPCLLFCFSTQSFCIFLTVVHDVKKGFGLDFVLYIVFLQEGAPSTWAWALPRPDSPIPRHKPRGLWQPPDRESGSQVSLHLPPHSGLPRNLPPSTFLGWEQGHLTPSVCLTVVQPAPASFPLPFHPGEYKELSSPNAFFLHAALQAKSSYIGRCIAAWWNPIPPAAMT